MTKNLLLTLSILTASTLFFTGCGHSEQEKELADFSNSMSTFTQNVINLDENINNIDAGSSEAVTDLLRLLDQLELEFDNLSETPVPDQYQSIRDLSSEAEENMSNAISYYHAAFESNPFSSTDADIAYQYYVRAMTRVKYIGYVLSGEIPEDENVTVEEETNEQLLIEKLLEKSSGEFTTGEIIEDFINRD